MLPPNPVPPQHPLALPSGFCLEEYRIMQVLGQGGFGITYLAEDTRMNVKVAIKELVPTDFVTRGAASTVVPLTQSTEEDFSWAKLRSSTKPGSWSGSTIPTLCECFVFSN